jgi:hypothetical protein
MFEDLATPDISKLPTRKGSDDTFACDKCAGTGVWVSRYGTHEGKCFACKGKGHFKTSPHARRKARDANAKRKVADAEANVALFAEEQPVAHKWLTENAGVKRNGEDNFAKSLLDGVRNYGSLTEKQLAAVYRIIADDAERAEAKQTKIDMSDLLRRFGLAQEAGIKRPKVNTGDLLFSLAPATGRNAGHVYVKGEEDGFGDRPYLGKITPDGELYPSRDASPEVIKRIAEIGADVVGSAKAHGAQHGNCCFCNRDLTTDESVSNGYGPICAGRYGLPWEVTEAFVEAKAALKEANEEAAL